MARPTKITPEHMEPYFEGIRLGMSVERAAQLAAVARSTINLAKHFRWFSDAEKSAQAECINRRLQRIDRAGEGGMVLSRKTTIKTQASTGDTTEVIEESFTRPEWTADAWVLERRFSDDFAKKDAADVPRTVNFIVNGTAVNPV